MSDLFLLSERQLRRISTYFPLSHGIPRVDDRPVLHGIIFVIRNGSRWRDAPEAYLRGDAPTKIRVDNGPEFVSRVLDHWA